MSAARGLRVRVGRSRVDLERIAGFMRTRLAPDVGLDEPLPLIDMFEDLDVLSPLKAGGAERRVRSSVENLGLGTEALTRYDATADSFDVVLDEATYEALEHGRDRRVTFTLPHEIGHLVLHREELLQLAMLPHHRALLRGQGQHEAFRDSEYQANGFAGAFVMPARGLDTLASRGQLSVATLQRRYNVSERAAEVRLAIFHEKRKELVAATLKL